MIELEARRVSLFPQSRDEDLRQGDPLARLGLLGACSNVREHIVDGFHVRHRLVELVHRGRGCVNVRVDKAGQNRFTVEVELVGAGAGKLHDVVICPGCHNVTVANRHGFGDVKLWIDRDDFAVVIDVACRRLSAAAEIGNQHKDEQGHGGFLHGQRVKGQGERDKGKGRKRGTQMRQDGV